MFGDNLYFLTNKKEKEILEAINSVGFKKACAGREYYSYDNTYDGILIKVSNDKKSLKYYEISEACKNKSRPLPETIVMLSASKLEEILKKSSDSKEVKNNELLKIIEMLKQLEPYAIYDSVKKDLDDKFLRQLSSKAGFAKQIASD